MKNEEENAMEWFWNLKSQQDCIIKNKKEECHASLVVSLLNKGNVVVTFQHVGK